MSMNSGSSNPFIAMTYQFGCHAPGAVDHDMHSLQRYLELLAEGQTMALDMLFAPDTAFTRPRLRALLPLLAAEGGDTRGLARLCSGHVLPPGSAISAWLRASSAAAM